MELVAFLYGSVLPYKEVYEKTARLSDYPGCRLYRMNMNKFVVRTQSFFINFRNFFSFVYEAETGKAKLTHCILPPVPGTHLNTSILVLSHSYFSTFCSSFARHC